jgi:ribosomal RNA assembly protein
MRVVQVPVNRFKALAKDPRMMRMIKENGNVELQLMEDSRIKIEGESSNEWVTEQVLSAVALGFEPAKAMKLFKEDFYMEKIDLSNVLRSDKAITRQKARIIGEKGRAKRTIEELTDAYLAISEKKVAILGHYEDIQLAKEAISRLVRGDTHATVYAFLEKKRRESKTLF